MVRAVMMVRMRRTGLSRYPLSFENLQASVWAGFHVNAKTPDAVVDTLNKAIYAALAKPEVRGPIEAGGATVYPPMTPKQVNDFYLKDAHEIEVVAKGMGFTKQ